MSDVSALSVTLLRRVAEFLDGLPEDHVADLAEGRARLTYVPWGGSTPVEPPRRKPAAPRRKPAAAPQRDPAEIVALLGQATSREEGRQLLMPLNLTPLKEVAKAAGMPGGLSKAKKDDLVEQVVALTIGGRLSFAAMRNP